MITSERYTLGNGVPITSVNDLGQGKSYPPMRESGRIEQFDRWFRWSKREYIGLDPEAYQELQRRFSETQGSQVRRLSPNMFRFVMRFWQDAVSSEPPIFDYDGSDREQAFVERIRPSLLEATREAIGDVIRYGCGVFHNRRPLLVEALDPRFWHPVRPAFDENEVEAEIIAYPFASGEEASNHDRIYLSLIHI